MLTPLGIASILFGVFICFMGYSIFRSMLPLWGFALGGFIGITVVPSFINVPESQQLFLMIGSFVGVGIIGAIISKPLYYVTVFLSGAAMGGLVGLVLGAYINVSGGAVSVRALSELAGMSFPPPIVSPIQVGLMVVLALIVGGFAISFQKFVIIASTAFLGSAAILSGLNNTIFDMLRSSNSGFLVVVGWLVVGMVGIFVQFRMGDEV